MMTVFTSELGSTGLNFAAGFSHFLCIFSW